MSNETPRTDAVVEGAYTEIVKTSRTLERELAEARAFGEDAARRYNELLAEGRVLRCAFCDAEYAPGTPPTQHEALTAHVWVCPQHPMRAVESELAEAQEIIANWERKETIRGSCCADNERRVKELEEALALYADDKNWRMGGLCDAESSHCDGGLKARRALRGEGGGDE